MDIYSPDVISPDSLSLAPDKSLSQRVGATRQLLRKLQRSRPSGLKLSASFDELLDGDDSSDSESPKGSESARLPVVSRPTSIQTAPLEPLLPPEIGAGLPLRDRSPSVLHRHRLESSVLELHSCDSLRNVSKSPVSRTFSPTSTDRKLRKSQTLSSDSFLPAIATSPLQKSRPLGDSGRFSSEGPIVTGGLSAEEYQKQSLTGSPGKWATVSETGPIVQTKRDLARISSFSDLSGFRSPLSKSSSTTVLLTPQARAVKLSQYSAGSPKAVATLLDAIADSEAKRMKAQELTALYDDAIATVTASLQHGSSAETAVETSESPTERKSPEFSDEAVIEAYRRLKLRDPSERMVELAPVQHLILTETGLDVQYEAWLFSSAHSLLQFIAWLFVCTFACSGCESMAASWRKNSTGLQELTVLDLSRNPLGSAGAAVIGAAFAAVNARLRELVMEDCDIRDSGLQSIVNVRKEGRMVGFEG